MYSLIKAQTKPSLLLTFIRDLPQEEAELIHLNLDSLKDVDKIHNKIRLIKSAIVDFEKNVEVNNGIKTQRTIIEILSLFYMYLETIKVIIRKDFGGDTSAEMGKFHVVTTQEFDNHFSYRFFYKFRNYVIHYEFPSFSVVKDIGNAPKATISKTDLNLDSSVWGAPLSKDFKTDICEFELISMFRELFECIIRISNTVINFYDISKILQSCKYILQYKTIIEEGEGLLVGKIVIKDGKISTFSDMKEFPFSHFEYFIENTKKGY